MLSQALFARSQIATPSMKTAQNMDGSSNFRLPSMKTAQNVDESSNFSGV